MSVIKNILVKVEPFKKGSPKILVC